MWNFGENISNIYEQHVRQHIPNYENILNLTVEIANDNLSKDSKICDFGSAKGNTLIKLHNNDFVNLYGVENSEHMRNKSPNIFKISETMPDIEFDLIIANWSLHFNRNKEEILSNFYDRLKTDSYLILSEKVSEDEYTSKKYYEWKIQQNVSIEEIEKKKELLKGSMFIDDVEWYLKTLKDIGFRRVEIINSYWCFSTFLCRK
jgi:SAM-dependent methyltransferase